MGTAADDTRDIEEMWEELKLDHMLGICTPYDCPYCDPDFEPLFAFQDLKKKEVGDE